MKTAILILALVAMAYAASITNNIEKQAQVENRLKELQQELEEIMTEMDESEMAIQAVDEVQKSLNVAKAQWRRYYTRTVYW